MPRPAVLPPLPAMPRPTRRRGRVEPGAGFKSWTFMGCRLRRLPPERGLLAHWFARCARSLFRLLHGDQVGYTGDHPSDLRTVGQEVALADAPEAQGPQGAPVF